MSVSEKREPCSSPNNLKLKVPLVLFPWERERVGCWCLGTRRTQQQQDGRWSDHQSLCNNRGRAVVDKSTKSAFSSILGDHILWKPQIFSQIFATSKWSFIKTSLVPPMMIRPPVTMPAPRASVCCTTSAFQSKFYSLAATQTGIENIHNLLSYPLKYFVLLARGYEIM